MYMFEMKDIKFDTFRSAVMGGQSVHALEAPVRATHLPTGITVEMNEHRSQMQNREAALEHINNQLIADAIRKIRENKQSVAISKMDSYRDGGTIVVRTRCSEIFFFDKKEFTLHSAMPTSDENKIDNPDLLNALKAEMILYHKKQMRDTLWTEDFYNKIFNPQTDNKLYPHVPEEFKHLKSGIRISGKECDSDGGKYVDAKA